MSRESIEHMGSIGVVIRFDVYHCSACGTMSGVPN